MPDFADIEAAIAHFGRLAGRMEAAAAVGLRKGAKIVLDEVRAEIGTYQLDNTGPANPWPELAESTKDSRVRQGYSENDPGLRNGEMAASYGIHAAGLHAEVGSDDEKAVFFENGTADRSGENKFHQQPRSALTIAAFRKAPEVAAAVAAEVLLALRK